MGLFDFLRAPPSPELWRPAPALFPAIALKIGENSHHIRLSWWRLTIQMLSAGAQYEMPDAATALSGRMLTAVTAFQAAAIGEYIGANPHIQREQAREFISALFSAVLGPDVNVWQPHLQRYRATWTVPDQLFLAIDLAKAFTNRAEDRSVKLITLLTTQAAAMNLLAQGVAAEAFQNRRVVELTKARLDILAKDPWAISDEIQRVLKQA